MSDNPSDNIRGRPFEKNKSGNPAGRPPGARNRSTLAAEVLLDGEAEALTRKAVELALNGDVNALRLCIERLIPRRREQLLDLEVRRLESLNDASDAMADIIAAVAAGNIDLSAAAELGKLIELYVRTCEVSVKIDERFVASVVKVAQLDKGKFELFAAALEMTMRMKR